MDLVWSRQIEEYTARGTNLSDLKHSVGGLSPDTSHSLSLHRLTYPSSFTLPTTLRTPGP